MISCWRVRAGDLGGGGELVSPLARFERRFLAQVVGFALGLPGDLLGLAAGAVEGGGGMRRVPLIRQ